MEQNHQVIDRVRAAMEDRALYLALLLRSFARVLPAAEAERAAREAIFEYGRLKGQRDGRPIEPADWVDHHVAKGSAEVFQSRIVKAEGRCEQQMTYCPLLEAWKKLGCTPQEMDLLCDIAMEVDRGRAAHHGLPVDIPMRLGKGDPYCCLVIHERP